jgi:hypothetical protein
MLIFEYKRPVYPQRTPYSPMDFSKPQYETELRVVINRENMTADEFIEEIKGLMLAIGYHPESIASALNEEPE